MKKIAAELYRIFFFYRQLGKVFQNFIFVAILFRKIDQVILF